MVRLTGETVFDTPAEMMRRIRSRYSIYYPMPEGKPAELTPDAQERFPGAVCFRGAATDLANGNKHTSLSSGPTHAENSVRRPLGEAHQR